MGRVSLRERERVVARDLVGELCWGIYFPFAGGCGGGQESQKIAWEIPTDCIG